MVRLAAVLAAVSATKLARAGLVTVAAALADLEAAAVRAAPELVWFWCLVITIRQKAAGERAAMLATAPEEEAAAEALVEWVSTGAQAEEEAAAARAASEEKEEAVVERPSG